MEFSYSSIPSKKDFFEQDFSYIYSLIKKTKEFFQIGTGQKTKQKSDYFFVW